MQLRIGIAAQNSALCLSLDAAPGAFCHVGGIAILPNLCNMIINDNFDLSGSIEAECPPPRLGPSVVGPSTASTPLLRIEGLEPLLSRLQLATTLITQPHLAASCLCGLQRIFEKNLILLRMSLTILLPRLNLTGGSPLRVGGGLVACIREGPGLRTTTGLLIAFEFKIDGALLKMI